MEIFSRSTTSSDASEQHFSSDLAIPNLPCTTPSNRRPLSPRKRHAPALPYLPTAFKSPHGGLTPRRRTELLSLPNEVLLSVVSNLPARDMAQARRLSRRIKYLAEVPLSAWAVERVQRLKGEVKEARSHLTSVRHRKLPLLRHYRAFLTNPTSTELSELASHPNPPSELRIVAACLLGLHGSLPTTTTTPSSTAATELPWPLLRRALLAPNFRRWLRSLPTIVDSIPSSRVALVDSIIVVTSLTYERARASSIAAYRLLIVVAAALQVKHLGQEVDEAGGRVERARSRWGVGRSFAGYLGVEVQGGDMAEEEDEEGEAAEGEEATASAAAA
ncbi:hypothetical protein HDU93_006562 [Gonapodya sp. JEL0774]|nr:hypothetical protein HDU93_006562 [Gonapodya sp. JEL0774]